jgi:demethylmenaquinone methyltransferase/2-methoxy-6-polyprenyl-1,4-benzoquinol methylase
VSDVGLDVEVLREQQRYYDERAEEYDDWFNRTGRYDRGELATAAWFREIEEVRTALEQLPLDGVHLLELAPGTGIWTSLIAPRAKSLTIVDGSLAMVDVARRRLGSLWDSVAFIHQDLFDWEPASVFDGVLMCFWLSHVPRAGLSDFVEKISKATAQGGVVFFLDSRPEPQSTANDHVLPKSDQELMTRRLDDGREFSIIKNFWDARFLEGQFDRHGITLKVTETASFFQFGVGVRR